MTMTFKPHRNALKKIMYYASSKERLIIKNPFGHTEFDRYLPEYIILKDKFEKEYHCLKLKSWLTDWMQEYGIITNINDIYSEYTPIWTGCKTLKEAKEVIIEEYNKELLK